MSSDPIDDLTLDPILRGRLRLWQPTKGYRFSLDPILLVDFVLSRCDEAPRHVLDLGTGSGVVALALQSRRAAWTVEAVEIQPRLAAIAQKNATENELPITIHEADVRARTLPGGAFDLVTTNPPYFRLADGPPSDHRELAIARHETELDLPSWVAEARRLLRPTGLCCCIFPVPRLEELLRALTDQKLYISSMRFVHSLADRSAELVLVAARKGDGRGTPALEVLPPLYVYTAPGDYTAEASRILDETGW